MIKNLHLLPIFLTALLLITVPIIYTIAVLRKDVNYFFPYISDTGSLPPESCIFTLVTIVAGIIMALIILIRYLFVKEILKNENFSINNNLKIINKLALYKGICSVIGLFIVGSFPETAVFSVHILGALMLFGFSVIYQWLQVYLSIKIYSVFGHIWSIYVKFIFTVICTVTFFLTFTYGALAYKHFKGSNILTWTVDDGGYSFHLISTISEWIMSLSMMFFFLSFSKEFRLFYFENLQIIDLNKLLKK